MKNVKEAQPQEVKQERPPKQFQFSKEELMEMELCQLKIANLTQQANAVIFKFCKRVGQNPEDIIVNPFGQVFIDPQGRVSFKESEPKKEAPKKR